MSDTTVTPATQADLNTLAAALVRTLLIRLRADNVEVEAGAVVRQTEAQAVHALETDGLTDTHLAVLLEVRRRHRLSLKLALDAREQHARARAVLSAAETALYGDS